MSVKETVLQQFISLLESKFSVPQEKIKGHYSEPLYGNFFQFDTIDMVYLIAEIRKEFGICIDDSSLANCFQWNVLDFSRCIAEGKADK